MPPRAPDDFAALFDAHVDHVWRVLRRLGVRDSDVEDVAQEVFMVAYRRLEEFEGRSAMRTWLYGICRRCAASHRRRAHRHREVPMESVPDRRDEGSPDGEAERHRALELLDRVLERLPERQRVAYVLYELEALPMNEVADVLKCPLQTAYARLYAARRAIRKALEDSGRDVA